MINSNGDVIINNNSIITPANDNKISLVGVKHLI